MSLLAQDQHLTRRVGAVTLALLAAAIGFFVFVYDQIEWGSPIRVHVYFLSTGGLQEGAPFIVAGKPLGHIESIALSPRGAVGKCGGATTPLAGEEGVVVTVALDGDAAKRVTKGGDVFVTSHGALSSRFLELGPPPPGLGPTLAECDEFRGNDPPSLDRVLQRTWDNLTTARRFVDEVRPEARALGAEIDKLQAMMFELAPEILFRSDYSELFDEARRTYAALGGDPGIARIQALGDHTETVIGEARVSIAKLRASADMLSAGLDVLKARLGGKGAQAIEHVEIAIARVRAAIAKVDPLLAQVDAIQQRIERGEGSLLKLARDPEFPEDAKELGKILKRQPWKLLDRPPK
jgi:hypothetical protein